MTGPGVPAEWVEALTQAAALAIARWFHDAADGFGEVRPDDEDREIAADVVDAVMPLVDLHVRAASERAARDARYDALTEAARHLPGLLAPRIVLDLRDRGTR